MSDSRQIVAIGLLTQQDLEMLGQGFDRAFPVDDNLVFEDLLRAIDQADREIAPGGQDS
jgi:hypothetical protein